MIFRVFARLLGGLVLVVLVMVGSAMAQSGGTVREIVVEGTQRIEPETIRSYLSVREGDQFDTERVNSSLKALFATGLFADVTIRRQGDSLVVTVVENPVINRIAFEGAKRIDEETLRNEITLRPRVIYTRSKVQADVQRILTLYRRKGRFAATVEPKVIRLEQNRVDLVFEISEGALTDVARIRFIGNKQFGDSRLRDVIRTRETHWYTFFTTDDTYDPDRLTLDRELLRRFYLAEGYADFNMVSAVAELTPDRKDFFITFTIEEGPRYEIGTVDVNVALKGIDPEAVKEVIEIEHGDWYNAEETDKTIEKIVTKVNDLGQPFVEVRPRVNRDREQKTIDLTFEVVEGPHLYVERIDIDGNVRTRDEVVRREFQLVEGDAFNSAKLRRSKQRIQDLNFFEKVNVDQVAGSAPDKTVIKTTVEEKSTGSFNIGVGYGSSSGALVDLNIRERNLLGKGQDLGIETIIAQRYQTIDLSFTEPYFMDREIAAGFDVFHTEYDRQDESHYDLKTNGGSLRANYPISDKLRQGWAYTLKEATLGNIPSSASDFIKAEEGTTVNSMVSHILTYDRRDSKINPTDGYIIRNMTDLAGLGGTSRFVRNTLSAARYYALGDQWVLSFNGQVGYVVSLGPDVHIGDRYNLGGDNLRGFASWGAGPRDTRTGDALGGEWMYAGTTQVTFPIGLPNEYGVSAHVFSDVGSLGGTPFSSPNIEDTGSIRLSAGIGIGWQSPMGLVGVDVGFPIMKESFDKTETFRINFGTRF